MRLPLLIRQKGRVAQFFFLKNGDIDRFLFGFDEWEVIWFMKIMCPLQLAQK
jgi:hypothetical protein